MKTKNSACESGRAVGRKDDGMPPKKKLKQARLPFQILSPGVESPSPPLKNSNKRKLSDSTEDLKVPKITRPNEGSKLGETKENVCSPTSPTDCKKSDSSNKTSNIGKEVEGRGRNSVGTSKVCESATSSKEGGEENSIETSVPKCESNRKSEGINFKRKLSQLSSKVISDEDVIVLSDSEDDSQKHNLIGKNDKAVSEKSENCVAEKSTVENGHIAPSLHVSHSEVNEKQDSPIGLTDKSVSKESVDDAEGNKSKKTEQDLPKLSDNEKSESPLVRQLMNREAETQEQVSQKPVDIKNEKLQECLLKSVEHTVNSKVEIPEKLKEEAVENGILCKLENCKEEQQKFGEHFGDDKLEIPEKVEQKSDLCITESKIEMPEQGHQKSEDIKSESYAPNGLKTPKQKKSPRNFKDIFTNNAAKQLKQISPQGNECTPKIESKTPKEVSPGSNPNSAHKIRKLTPKQVQKQLESAKKKEEKERQRQEREKRKLEEKEEREKKKAEEKEEKLRQKQEKDEQKKKEREEKEDQKRKEREEKEEQKKKEKEEKERKKQVELEMKNEEKKAKDEEKRKKEDKMQAEAAAFTSFFRSKKAELKPVDEPKTKAVENFMPFEVKADMRLAPNVRTKLTDDCKDSLEISMEEQSVTRLYLDQIRNKEITPKIGSCTWALCDFKNDVVILGTDDDEISGSVTNSVIESYPAAGQLPRPKLLQFWENRRPPYWGTWRKKSQFICPTKPFEKDGKFFDYEVDSDDEWEEEEPGESLHGSDDEKESEDEYEVDNDFFVPHGYLSDEENVEQEDGEDQSPEMLKVKLKVMALEFEAEMKQKTERLKPRLIGCIWIDPKTADSAGGQLMKLLSPYQAVYEDGPILTAPDPASATGSPESGNLGTSPPTSGLKRKKFPEEAIPTLLKLIHGNVNRREFLVREFFAHWNNGRQKIVSEKSVEGVTEGNTSALPSTSDISKKSISIKIKELAAWVACPDECPMKGRMCWYVPAETRVAHGFPDFSLPNTLWTYTINPKRRESDGISSPSCAVSNESNPKQLITKFTKVMSEVERKKQFSSSITTDTTDAKFAGSGSSQRKLVFSPSVKTSTPKSSEQRKRVPILMSGPRGQDLPKSKNSLMQFIKPQSGAVSDPNCVKNSDTDTMKNRDDDCVVLSD